jgi:hypothetical protein
MAGGVVVEGTTDVARTEAPVTFKAYLICAFAAFGGIFFGYDTGKSPENLPGCCSTPRRQRLSYTNVCRKVG